MLELDVLVVAELTKRFMAGMLARDRGWILLVSSVAGYQPSPSYAAYAAAKAYVLHFGIALAHELRRSKVEVCVLSPGITHTEFFDVAGQTPSLYHRLTGMSAERAVEAGLHALLRGRASVLPGFVNGVGAFLTRVVPMRLQARIVGWLMRAE